MSLLTNTQTRILSALAMTALVALCFYLGQQAVLAFVFVAMLLTHDEIFCNLIKAKRFSKNYWLSAAIIIFPFIIFSFLLKSLIFLSLFANLTILLCALLVVYLFYVDFDSEIIVKWAQKIPLLAGVYCSLFSLSLANLLMREDWQSLCFLLFFIAFGMDTGAWFVGVRWGKRKLWPTVSPKKTVEGLVGGALIAGICGGIVANIVWGEMNLGFFLVFIFLGLVSQVGDLIQSKLKRQFGVKDSSKLIPGHGGVYDRIDSLIFLAPVFLGVLKLLGR